MNTMLVVAPNPAAALAALPADHPDAKLFTLACELDEADWAIDAATAACKHGEMPDTDEAMEPFYDAQSEAMHAILTEPANSIEGMLIKARVAMRLASFYPDDRPATPEEVYAWGAEDIDLNENVSVASLWADLERLMATTA